MTEKLSRIIDKIIEFRDERDWRRFHDSKNLAEAITIKAGELLESFLWMTTGESKEIDSTKLDKIKNEVSDIFIYMVYLCNVLNINLMEEVESKIEKNRNKYPVDKSKGSSKKYTEF